MKEKIYKFLEIEDKLFRAPYNFLKEKGIIDKVKEIKTRFVEIYARTKRFHMVEIKCSLVTTKEFSNYFLGVVFPLDS